MAADIEENWQQLREANRFLVEIARHQREDFELLCKLGVHVDPPAMDAAAVAASPNLCVFDIPSPVVRAAIDADFDDPSRAIVRETSANTDPYACQPPATRGSAAGDADVAEIDAAIEREIAVGLDVAEQPLGEM